MDGNHENYTRGKHLRFVKDYMRDDVLRHELNELTRKTFCFDFENWVTNGYFEGDYFPYSFEEEGKILSNVSANRMYFEQNGKKRYYIQIGTVMTDKDHRKQGLAGKLIKHVLETYEGECDGIYLFGNLSALDFYRELGFQEILQYRYTLRTDARVKIQGKDFKDLQKKGFVRVDAKDASMKKKYGEAVRRSFANSAFEQENKYSLQMFYTSEMENVYYSEELNCFAVMEKEGETLLLQSVICPTYVSLESVLREIHSDYENLVLGFTPRKEEADLFDAALFDGGEEYRLFIRGDKLNSIGDEKLYFPVFSHA